MPGTFIPASPPGQGPAPVLVVVEVDAKPGDEARVADELLAATRRWAGEAGCTRATAWQDPHDKARHLTLEEFVSEDALRAHLAVPSTHEFVGSVQRYLSAQPARSIWHQVRQAAAPAAALSPEEINIRWCEAFNAGNVSAMLEMYEPGAVLVPAPDAQPVSGLHAIESALHWLVGTGGKINYRPRFWLQNGELAMGRIDFDLSGATDPEGNRIDMRGATSEVARRQQDGTWKYVFDHPFGASLT